MLPIGAVVVDFDGTACAHDVAEHLLEEFGDPSWPGYDEAWGRGEIGARDALRAQDAMLRADRETMVGFALGHCPMDPTFAPFVRRLADRGVAVALASDGFGFYVEPILRSAGLGHLEVFTNEQVWNERDRPAGLRFSRSHDACGWCGTCKMQVVQAKRDAHGPVAFVGEGPSDRYGAMHADVVFAKDALVAICEREGVPYVPYETFEDVRDSLESLQAVPGLVGPATCPGWTLP